MNVQESLRWAKVSGRSWLMNTINMKLDNIMIHFLHRCQMVRKLTGVTHPINLVPIDEHKCVVLCRRELRVYDLDQVSFSSIVNAICLEGPNSQF